METLKCCILPNLAAASLAEALPVAAPAMTWHARPFWALLCILKSAFRFNQLMQLSAKNIS